MLTIAEYQERYMRPALRKMFDCDDATIDRMLEGAFEDGELAKFTVGGLTVAITVNDRTEEPIQCGALYNLTGGYDHDGGCYDTAQAALKRMGWAYEVATDAWLPPP